MCYTIKEYIKIQRMHIMNKGLLWTFCLVLCCVILPCFLCTNQNNVVYASSVYTPSTLELNATPTSLQDITINQDNIYISDKNSQTVYVYNFKTTQSQQIDLPSAMPHKLTFNYADNLVASISNLSQIRIIGKTTSIYSTFVYNNTPFNFSEIYDIAQDTNNNIYAIIKGNGKYYLVKKEVDKENFEYFMDMPTLNENSKLAINFTGDKILLLNNNQIFKINASECVLDATYNYPELSTITSINFDHKDDLYVLSAEGTLTRCTTSNYTQIQIAQADTMLNFCLSPSNNTIYFVHPNKITYLSNIVIDEKPFVNNISTTPNIDLNTSTTLTPLNTIKTNAPTFIYEYDNMISKIKEIPQNTKLTILENNTESNFYYVLDTSTQYNVLGYVLKDKATLTTATNPETTYQCLFNTNVYAFPTTLKNTAESDVRILTTLPKDSLINSITSYITPTDYNNASFVFVKATVNLIDYYGYVDVRYLTENSANTTIKPIFVSNAITKTEIAVYSNPECSSILNTLEKNIKVQILSTQNGISYIKWQDEGESYFGYTQYKNLDDGSISTSQAIGFLLMLLAIVASLVTLTIIKNNKAKHKNDD